MPPLAFAFDRTILAGAGDIALQVDAGSTGLALALAANTPVPAATEPVILGSAAVGVEAGKSLAIGSDTAKVTFGASAAAKLGIFPLPAQLRDGIVDGGDLADSVEAALDFDTGSNAPFLLLRLGYDVNAAATGAVALGVAGSLKFGVNAGRAGLYAVVRQPAADRGARDAVTDLVRSVRLPRQVRTADDLQPGTWIIAEADGSLGFRGEVRFGHDFSWIREIQLGPGNTALRGDIGLKVVASVAATLGFNVAGKYAVVVSRSSLAQTDRTVRVRVFKLRMRQFDFAFRAEATVTPETGLLPDQVDDFLKGVLGVHGAQVVAALGRVRDWTDPATPLFGPFVGLAVDEARTLVGHVVDLEDVVAKFNEARRRIQTLFDKWDALPAGVTSRLLALLDQKPVIASVREIAGRIAKADDARVKAFLKEKLGDVAFLRGPIGELLQQLIPEGFFGALTNTDVLERLRSRARQLLDLLDGGQVEATLIRLQKIVTERLRLDQIEAAVAAADPARLDPWLRARLEHFLEEKLGANAIARLEELRAAMRRLADLAPQLYRKSLEALRRDYQFSLSASYQKATTTTALIDAEFDFNADAAGAEEGLRVCLAGGFDALIDRPRRGVIVHEGALTHAVVRQTTVRVALPYFERTRTHVTRSLATLRAPAVIGSELLFGLEASDVVTVKNHHSAALTISMLLPQIEDAPSRDKHEVRIHDKASASYQQALDVALRKASIDDLVEYAQPFVEPLFRSELRGEFRAWVTDAFGDRPTLGNALLALDVTLPPEACLAWTSAPTDSKSEVYQRLSLALQRHFKQLLHDVFFHSIDTYETVGPGTPVSAVLVFASLPPITDMRRRGDRVEVAPAQFSSKHVHWDGEDEDLVSALAGSDAAQAALKQRLDGVRRRLQGAGRSELAQFYKDSQITRMLGDALEHTPGKNVLQSLIFVETEIVNQARAAGLHMAAFRQHRDAAKARKDLATFGLKVTETFNEKLGNIAVSGALRPLGALMFSTAARVFDPLLEQRGASAMLNIIDVRDDVSFPPEGFPDHAPVAEADILRSETLVHAAD